MHIFGWTYDYATMVSRMQKIRKPCFYLHFDAKSRMGYKYLRVSTEKYAAAESFEYRNKYSWREIGGERTL